jgi:peptidyl-prolyl cis-trans isomerase SurA
MNRLLTSRFAMTSAAIGCACIAAVVSVPLLAAAQAVDKNAEPESSVIFDRVVAVVNRQAILASDVEDEMQLSVLDPTRIARAKMTEQQALERLISRALIQQQIRQEDLSATGPMPDEIASRLKDIRTELPACVRAHCETDGGWKAFLTQHDLTLPEVEDYLRRRIEILSFIEMRFRQGIRITPEEIEEYYAGTLLPEYPAGQKPPPLQQVSSRIEEILLQQRVNQVFDNWLANLRKQGQIEVVDPTIETQDANGDQGAVKE